MIKTLLDADKRAGITRETCPLCGASWREMEASLHEGKASPNYGIAQMMLENCIVCKVHFMEVNSDTKR